jgi:hypothetical protein
LFLGALDITGEKNDQHRSTLLKIDSVPRAIVDRQFCDPSPNRPDIARIAADEALNPCLNQRLGPEIPKIPEPAGELLCTAGYNNSDTVASWLGGSKGSSSQPQSEAAILRTGSQTGPPIATAEI